MTDLVFVFRNLPKPTDPFWQLLMLSGLTASERASDTPTAARHGIGLARLAATRASRDEIDPDIARSGAMERMAAAVEELEASLAKLHPRIVAFTGLQLYASALGSRAEDALADFHDEAAETDELLHRSILTFRLRVKFAGGIAVSIPAFSKRTPPEVLINSYRELARLRAELTPRNES